MVITCKEYFMSYVWLKLTCHHIDSYVPKTTAYPCAFLIHLVANNPLDNYNPSQRHSEPEPNLAFSFQPSDSSFEGLPPLAFR